MSLNQGWGNSASTPHPFLILSYSWSSLCLISRGLLPQFQGRGRQKRQVPHHVPLTDTSLLSATLSLFPEGRPLSLISCPPARKSGSCFLWRLKGLKSQYDLRASLVLASHMTEKKTEPQKVEVAELDY